MTLNEQIKVVNKYANFVKDNKSKWIASGKVDELTVNYEQECLEYAVNSLIEIREFQLKLAVRNTKNEI